MTQNNIKEMIELSRGKKALLIQVLNLTKTQSDVIEKEDMDALDNLLGHKEKIMSEIDVLDGRFLSLYNAIKAEEGIDSLEKIDMDKYTNIRSLKEVVLEINKILNEISISDRNNTIKMKTQVEKIKSDLKQVKEVKRAYKGYNYEPVESMLIDEKK